MSMETASALLAQRPASFPAKQFGFLDGANGASRLRAEEARVTKEVDVPSNSDPPRTRSPATDSLHSFSSIDQLRDFARDMLSEASNTKAQNASIFTSSFFSFQASFSQYRSSSSNGQGFSNMLADIDTRYQDLMAFDSAQGERLGILASLLAQLNPETADAIMETIQSALTRLQDALSALTGSPQMPDPNTQASPQGEGSSASILYFELDLEIRITQETEVVMEGLSRNGFNYEAIRVDATATMQIHIEFTGIQASMLQSDPLVLDLAGDGVNLTGANKEGSLFDINADGRPDQSGFVQGDDAFLALDRNHNGRIDNGGELFGDQHGAVNGFEELALFDENNDGQIDHRDAIFSDLLLLHDLNRDGSVGLREVSQLLDQGIASLDLGYVLEPLQDDNRGNTLAERGHFLRSNGNYSSMVDAWIGYH